MMIRLSLHGIDIDIDIDTGSVAAASLESRQAETTNVPTDAVKYAVRKYKRENLGSASQV
jgi:hypothetical protein